MSVVNTKNRWIILLLIAAVAFRSGYPLSLAYGRLSYLILAVVCAVFLLLAVQRGRFMVYLGAKEAFVLVALFSIVTAALVNFDFASYKSHLNYAMFVILAYCASQIIPKDVFSRYFILSMRVIIGLSLLFYILANVLGIPLPVTYAHGGRPYYNAIVYLQLVGVPRNSGIFWEPSLYAVFITLTMIFEVLYNHNTRYKLVFFILEVAALITTRSPSAYLYAVLVIILWLFRSPPHKLTAAQVMTRIFVLLLAAVVIVKYDSLLLLLKNWNNEVFYKLDSDNGSFAYRLYNPIVDIMILIDSRGFGCSVSSYAAMLHTKSLQIGHFVGTHTSTLTYFAAVYGLGFGIAYNWLLVKGIMQVRQVDLFNKIIILMIFVYVSMTISLADNMSFWLILFMLPENTRENAMATENTLKKDLTALC